MSVVYTIIKDIGGYPKMVNRSWDKNWILMQLEGNEIEGDKWGHRWRATQKLRYEETINFIKSKIDIYRSYDILDIGCAHGDFTKIITETFINSNIFASDIAEIAIESAKRYVGKGEYEVCELPNLPFKGRKFDIIFAIEVLYYLDTSDRYKSVENIYKKLKNKGYFVFSSVIDDGSRRYFSEKEAIDMIERYFEIVGIGYTHTRIAVKFEQIFMKIVSIYELIKNTKKDNNVNRGRREYLRKILSNKLVNIIARVLLYPPYKISKIIVSSNRIMKFIRDLSILLCEKKARGNIIIIGRKRHG